jgi:hypothetical protein
MQVDLVFGVMMIPRLDGLENGAYSAARRHARTMLLWTMLPRFQVKFREQGSLYSSSILAILSIFDPDSFGMSW